MQGCLHFRDVTLNGDMITVSFREFKHSSRQGPQSLQINGQCVLGTPIYPATWLRVFFQVRGSMQAYTDDTAMLWREFDVILKCLLKFCGPKITVSGLERPHR